MSLVLVDVEEELKADIMDEVESSLLSLSSGVLECEYDNDAGSLAAAPYGTNTMLLLLLLVDDGDGGGGDVEPEAAWAIIRFKLFPGVVGGEGGGATC